MRVLSGRSLLFLFFTTYLGGFGCGETVPRCDLDGECLPNYVCEAGRCIIGGETIRTGNCGIEGCLVTGNQGAIARIPALALTEDLQISLNVAEEGSSSPDLNRISPIYALEPGGLRLQIPAQFEFPLGPELGVEVSETRVYWAETSESAWKPLTGSSEGISAAGEFDQFGLFFVARR